MSDITDILAVDLATIADEAGAAVTHTADGVDTAVAAALWEEFEPDEADNPDGRGIHRRAEAVIAAADVATIDPGDALLVAAESWTVVTAVPIAGGAWWRCQCRRTEPRARARQGLRLQR